MFLVWKQENVLVQKCQPYLTGFEFKVVCNYDLFLQVIELIYTFVATEILVL